MRRLFITALFGLLFLVFFWRVPTTEAEPLTPTVEFVTPAPHTAGQTIEFQASNCTANSDVDFFVNPPGGSGGTVPERRILADESGKAKFSRQFPPPAPGITEWSVWVRCDGKDSNVLSVPITNPIPTAPILPALPHLANLDISPVGPYNAGQKVEFNVYGCVRKKGVEFFSKIPGDPVLDFPGDLALKSKTGNANGLGNATFKCELSEGEWEFWVNCGGGTSNKISIIVDPAVTPTLTPPPSPCASMGADGKCAAILSGVGKLSTKPGEFIVNLFAKILGFSGGIALFLIIKAGYQIIMSKGNPEALQQGRDQLIAAIVGLLFLIFSFVILQVIGVDILRIPTSGVPVPVTPGVDPTPAIPTAPICSIQ